MEMKIFLSYFASKMILLFFFFVQNVAIYLLKYFVSHIKVVPWDGTFYNTGVIKFPKECALHKFMK